MPQPSTAAPFEVATVASLGAVAVSFTHVVKAAVCFFCKLNGGIVWESVRTIGNLGKSGKTWRNYWKTYYLYLFVSISMGANSEKHD